MSSRSLLKTAAAGAMLGVGVYVGADVIGEYTTYRVLHEQGLAFAQQDEQLKQQIGTPFETSPWFNASIGFTQSGHIAAITFPLKGSKQITDVTVRAVRRPGVKSAALYNLMGGEWKVLDASAMAPQQGGMVRPRSIMPYQAVPKVEDGKVVQGEECEECNRKAGDSAGAKGAAAPAAAAGGAAAAAAKAAVEPAGSSSSSSSKEEGQPEQKKRRRFWFF